MLVSLDNVNKYYNGNQILKNINMTIEDNDRIGLIGVNGCGKTTLLKLLTGIEEFDKTQDGKGAIAISSNDTIGFLKQNSGLDNDNTILQEMLSTFSKLIDISKRMRELEGLIAALDINADKDKYSSASSEYASISAYFENQEGYLIDVKIKTILNGMGFENTPTDRKISTLSGGEKTRLALAKLLLENPNLLILDEPTNHLDFKTLMWLENYLQSYKGALLIVSHDRYFLNRICTKICEIERGQLTAFKGDYSSYVVQKEMLVERQIKEYEQQQLQIAQLQDYINKNKVRASTANMAKSRESALEKIEVLERPLTYQKPPKITLEYDIIPPKEILKVDNLEVSVGEGENEKLLISCLSFEVRRGEKVGIIGPNGIGKSTVLKLIQGKLPKKRGKIHWANNVKISYFEQENSHLNFNNTVLEELHRRYPRETEQSLRTLLGKVLLTGENVFKPVKVISGGERAKLCFAIMMHEGGNVLILDEPTNHLDLATKEVLEQALEAFDGTIIFVSHDRYLLNKISTKILELGADNADEYKGNFDFYVAQKQEQEQEEQKIIEQQKIERQKQQTAENKTKTYKSREQRSIEVQRKNQIKSLENDIELLQEQINEIEAEILLPEIFSDYQLMAQKCNKLDSLKAILSEKFDEWITICE